MTMQIDSGSEANCLRVKDFLKIDNRPPLKKSRVVLKTFNGEGVIPKGKVFLDIYIPIGGQRTRTRFLVVEDAPS